MPLKVEVTVFRSPELDGLIIMVRGSDGKESTAVVCRYCFDMFLLEFSVVVPR